MKLKHSADMRAKALAVAIKRKEEYLGARVPKELKERVIRQAKELDIPVSILLRKILEDAFDSPRWRSAEAERELKKTKVSHDAIHNRFPMVLGWENIRLNRAASCFNCGERLEPGKQVILGVSSPEEERILLCDVCKESL